MSKHRLMTFTVLGTGAAISAAAAVPVAINLFAPLKEPGPSEEQRWKSLGSVELYPVGKVTQAILRISDEREHQPLADRSVYVVRKSEAEFVVFSRACSDLGCPIVWDAGSEWFFCPCHGGIFDKDGERRAGPPKRGLYRYEFRVEEGDLKIDVMSVPPMA